ncbi:MAG: hypothetical protein Q4D57_03170 [Clostridia bacterium]|nr:hypothetical protein [Clostridia bacterium]
MSLKKAICTALSLCMITGGGIVTKSSVHANSTRKIVQNFEFEGLAECERVAKIFNRTKYFINKEHHNTKLYDFSLKRLDSLAFCYFCYLCMMEDNTEINSLVNRAVGMRIQDENEEDTHVIDIIFPTNADEFLRRFGIKLEETIRSEVSARIHQWRPDTQTVPPMEKYYRGRPDRRFVRKPRKQIFEKIRDGISIYWDMNDPDTYIYYSDSDTDTSTDTDTDMDSSDSE